MNNLISSQLLRIISTIQLPSICLMLLTASGLTSANLVNNAKDFANAEEVEKNVYSVQRKVLMLGQLKRIRGVMEPENSAIVQAERITRTLKIPEGPKTEVVYEHYRKQLNLTDYETLFQCQGRGCGPANDWANQVFEEAQLYGPDRYQHYSVSRISDTKVLILYVSQRGTRDVMVHYEAWNLTEPLQVRVDPREQFMKSLETSAHAWLSGWEANGGQLDLIASRESLDILAAGIRQYPEKNVGIIVHLSQGGQPSTLFSQSESIAEQLLGYYKSRGLNVFVKALGPMESELKHEYGGMAVNRGEVVVEVTLF